MERKKENEREKEREVNTTTTKKEREKYREKRQGGILFPYSLVQYLLYSPLKYVCNVSKRYFTFESIVHFPAKCSARFWSD